MLRYKRLALPKIVLSISNRAPKHPHHHQRTTCKGNRRSSKWPLCQQTLLLTICTGVPLPVPVYQCQDGTSRRESSPADLILNFVLKVRTLRFSRHLRLKCHKSIFLEQKSLKLPLNPKCFAWPKKQQIFVCFLPCLPFFLHFYPFKISKHLKGHLAPRVSHVFGSEGHSWQPDSDITFLDQRIILGSLSVT